MGAVRLDELMDIVTPEVAGALRADLEDVRIGATSLAPRDEAARAARWVARLTARRGVRATLASPDARSWDGDRGHAIPGAPLRARLTARLGADDDSASVGVSRLDLSPVVAAVVQPYAVGVWLPLETRALRFRRGLSSEPDEQAIDAAIAARPVSTLVVGQVQGLAIALVGTDLLAVEVVARALRAAAQPVGDLGLSPWQTPVVQRGVERAAGVPHPDRIDLESIWLGDPRDFGHDRLHRVVDVAAARAGISMRA